MRFAVYRTEADPGVGAPFYRVTSLDPTSASYLENDATSTSLLTLIDSVTDAALVALEPDYQNTGELDNVGPSSATVIASGQDRMFTAGFEDESLVRYSKLRFEGDAFSHHDGLSMRIPQQGGAVVAIHSSSQAVVVFKKTAIYIISGEGENNLGQGSYGTPQRVPSDVGCSDARTIAQLPIGVMFQSAKGFYLLTPGFQVQYLGAAVESFNSQTYVSGTVVEDKHQVRFLTSSGSTVVFDYFANQWSTWTNHTGEDATNHKGTYYYLVSSVVRKQASTYLDNATDYGLAIETSWIKLGDLLGYARVRRIGILGENEGTHRLRVKVAYNYTDTWIDDVTWVVSPATLNTPEEVRMRTQQQKCSAIKVRVEDIQNAGSSDRLEGLKLTGLTLELGRKTGIRRLPALQTE